MGLEGHRIARASEMARVEKLSIDEGASSEQYMLTAGEKIAARIEQLIAAKKCDREVVFLIGKGNNGGDGYVAGKLLKKAGYRVRAYHFFPFEQSSILCQKQEKSFIAAGGDVIYPKSIREISLCDNGLVIDGLFGTGFQGKLEGLIAELVQKINSSSIPVLAIDIPSGVNGDTGLVESLAIEAEETLFLGVPKWGFFIGQGSDYVGRLSGVSFGLDLRYLRKMQTEAHLVNERELRTCLPSIKRSQHKYQAGYVLALAGSLAMPGAAILSCLAAFRAGAGMVRLFHPEEMRPELACAPYELVRTAYRPPDIEPLVAEISRASAWLIGPGLGTSEQVKKMLPLLLPQLKVPAVIDADGLFLCADHWKKIQVPCVLTPHCGEMERLLGKKNLARAELVAHCQQFCQDMNVTLLLKGVPTFVFHPDELPLVIMRGDPGMATAGSGDVLTGMIAALIAKQLDVRSAAVLGAYLHALAGEHSAATRHTHSLMASDLIDALPVAFQAIAPKKDSQIKSVG
ncbi:MAG: NAD(P)H-hydrate dehydratase [Chlamydiota bacterium]